MGNHFVDGILRRGADDSVFLVGGREREAWTYARLRRRVARFAGALVSRGVGPGDRVAARIEKSEEGMALYLGTLAAGAVFLPLNTAYTPVELAYFLGDAEPALLVCDPGDLAALEPIATCPLLTLDGLGRGTLADAVAAADPIAPVARGADDLAAILYTSGTTGRSKGAMLTHGNLVSNAQALVQIWRFGPHDRLIHALPIHHTHGLFTALNTVLAAGASMIVLPKFDPGSVIAAMAGASVLMGVPTYYTRLLDHEGLDRVVVSGMRLFVSGSAPLLAETHRRFADRTGHAILERYGMTETGMNCSNPHDGERRAGTVGFPLPDVSLRIVDPQTGAMLPRGGIGVIEVAGPNVCSGYWRNPEKTAAEFRPDGFFATGDLGRIDEDGYLHISGRGKDLVISGGFNVYPKEIELEIDGLEGVEESAVIGLPHRDLGEGVTAIVVPRPDAPRDEAAILASLRDRLARYKQPRRVVFVDSLPRNTMGKVQKTVLRDRFKSIYEA